MALGQYLSLPKDEVLQLGKCASLHDVGLFFIPAEILQKQDYLTPKELEKVKKHTVLGYNTMKKLKIADDTMCFSIACHHERLDGMGYPLGLQGEKIPLWSRIIAVADVYDAMTSTRPYSPPLTPSEAYEYIMANVNSAFEYDIVSAMLRRIEFYPVGICVELSNKNRAVILDNSNNKLRPIVRIFNSDTIVDLSTEQSYLDVTILRVVSYREIIEQEENRQRLFS